MVLNNSLPELLFMSVSRTDLKLLHVDRCILKPEAAQRTYMQVVQRNSFPIFPPPLFSGGGGGQFQDHKKLAMQHLPLVMVSSYSTFPTSSTSLFRLSSFLLIFFLFLLSLTVHTQQSHQHREAQSSSWGTKEKKVTVIVDLLIQP